MKKISIDRRRFIKLSSLASGSLVIGFSLPGLSAAAQLPYDCEYFQPSAYLRIDKKGKVTIYVAKQESGQGVDTALPMILAEELDVDLRDVHVEIAPYGTLKEGEHDTGGSQSVIQMYDVLRKAGATAKSMLVSAAARHWGVKPELCAADNGTVVNTANMARLSYGDLVCDAAALPVPATVSLKSPKDFRLIGKTEKRTGLKNILTGKTKYGLDQKIPGMAYAAVLRCPVFGGKLISYDDSAVKNMKGVLKVVSYKGTDAPMHIRDGVAVIAVNSWTALKARDLIRATWDDAAGRGVNTDDLAKKLEERTRNSPQIKVADKGNVDSVKGDIITATYTEPFLAHATIEPMNCTAAVKGDQVELWGGFQLPDWAVNTIIKEFGYKKENIKLNLTLMGGGFGRRLHFEPALEAVKIAQQFDRPVQLIWDRADDTRFDAYRPASAHRLEAKLDKGGKLLSWQHHIAGTSVSTMTEGPDTKNLAENSGGADKDFWYDVPNVRTGYSHVEFKLNRGWLRAVDVCVNTFPIESFIDEIAQHLKKDPLEYRLSLLEGKAPFSVEQWGATYQQNPARLAAVLKLAAEKIGWKNAREKDHYIGLATHSFLPAKAYAAHAVEIEVTGPKKFRIRKIVGAIDCGLVINPDGLRNQMEGAIAFGLTQALKGEITVQEGKVVEDGFYSYELLRFDEMPPIEIHTIDSQEEPGGVGEVGLPTVAPALCNALAAAGMRPRNLPLRKEGFVLGG